MKNYSKDILVGALFLAGLTGFISGEFIISSALFATAAVVSKVYRVELPAKSKQISCD